MKTTTAKKTKTQIFETMRPQIEEVFKDVATRKRVVSLLADAESQTYSGRTTLKPLPSQARRFVDLWRIRFHYGIHWKKPFYPFRLARNVLIGKLSNAANRRHYVLRGIEFAITYKCNFRCNHCLCSRIEESDTRREMTPKDYRRIVDEAMALGCTTFGLEGGEPFISPIWQDVIEACRPKTNHIIISTNGFLANEENIKKAAKLGVDTINFSLDSGYPELHDLFRRRRGSFDRVMAGIKHCRKYGLKVIINTVVYKGNLYTDHFRALLDFGQKEGLMINTLFAKGVGAFKDHNVMLEPEDIKDYEKIISPYTVVQRHLNHNYGRQWGCPGTKEMINMTPYGDVLNCANMHIYLGNVLEEPLADIRKRALKYTPFGRYHNCFLADDQDFMRVYYGLLDKKGHVNVEEFREALFKYEETCGRCVYPELREGV